MLPSNSLLLYLRSLIYIFPSFSFFSHLSLSLIHSFNLPTHSNLLSWRYYSLTIIFRFDGHEAPNLHIFLAYQFLLFFNNFHSLAYFLVIWHLYKLGKQPFFINSMIIYNIQWPEKCFCILTPSTAFISFKSISSVQRNDVLWKGPTFIILAHKHIFYFAHPGQPAIRCSARYFFLFTENRVVVPVIYFGFNLFQ
jgi:hypothetical protein